MKRSVCRIASIFCFIFVWNNTNAHTWIPIDTDKETKAVSSQILESNSSIYKVKYTINGLYDEIIDNQQGRFHSLSFGNTAHLSNIGCPELPLITQSIAIPNSGEFSVFLEEGKWFDIEIGTILPAQKVLLEEEKDTSFSMDITAYSNNYIPEMIYKGKEMDWRGIKNAIIKICPFKYFPTSNRLSVLREFVLSVKFSQTDKKGEETMKDLWKLFENCSFSGNDNTRSYTSNSYDYLIIVGTNDILNSQKLKEFQQWKAFKGYKCKAVSTSSTGTSTSSIKNYITQEYTNGVRYVLFVGDDDVIPLKNITSAMNRIVKSDYWYGCLGGDNDMQADVTIGRFSTNSLSEFCNMVDKSIKYEKEYYATNKALLVANKENAPDKYQGCCETIRNTSYSSSLSFTKLYGASASVGGTNATNAQIVSEINNSAHIVNYRGHGGSKRWTDWNTANEDFQDTEINNINEETSAVFFSIACWTGNIRNQTCMLETFTRPQHGAVAFLGATEDSYTIANHIFNQNLFKNLLNNGIFQIGDLNVASHIQNFSTNGQAAYDNAFCYLCGGDPTLEIWTASPQQFPGVQLIISDIINLCPGVGDYEVSIVSEDGDLIQKITVPYSVCAFIPPTDNFYIVINKHNYYPYIIYYNSSTNYIQNVTFDYDAYYMNNPIEAGYDVTSNMPFGNVIIKNGANMKIKMGIEGVTIKNGFECEKGGTLVVE